MIMSNIKECFTSRWGDDGVIMEADFSQLEVIGLAIISDDEQLKQDILNGIDFHAQTASWLFDVPYNDILDGVRAGNTRYKQMRQAAKEPNFLNQYGGGAWLMAKNTGIDKKKCQKFIDEYYNRYTGVKAFQDTVMNTVSRNRKPSKKKSPSGLPLGIGYYPSITGRRYVFYEYEDELKTISWKKSPSTSTASFSPTEMKNYPVQGFATGDIVPEVLGRLYRWCIREFPESVKMVGTVHDSVVFDVRKGIAAHVAKKIKLIMESSPRYMRQRYGIEIDLPLKADVEYAESWAACK